MNSPKAPVGAAVAILVSAACAAPPPPGRPADPERIAAGIAFEPLSVRPRAVNMGRLRPGAGHSRRIEARAIAPGVSISGAEVDGTGFSIEPSAPGPGRAAFQLRFEGAEGTGPVAAEVRIGYRDAAGPAGELTVPVVGSVAGDLRVARGIYLHRRGDGYPPREVTVGRRSGGAVRLEAVEDPDGLLAVVLTEPEGKPASLRLEVADPRREEDGTVPHPLLLRIADEREPLVRLEYRIDSGRK